MTHRSTLSPQSCRMTFFLANMKLLPLICLSVSVTAGIHLVQSPPHVTVMPGSKVSLKCNITETGETHGCSRVTWLHIRQVSGLSATPWFTSRVQSRLCLLEVPRATQQDAGMYFCVYIDGVMPVLGSGTTVTVTESELHSPALDLLAPSHVSSSLPVPLICLASGLNDTGRVKVDWEVESEEDDGAHVLKELSPRILPVTRAGVISTQVYVPAETWSAGVKVSCVLSDGERMSRKTISSGTDEVKLSSQCVFLTSITGTACAAFFTSTVALCILLSRRQKKTPKISEETSPELHYAALRFSASGGRNIR
ncbi:uncharacterized protein LOC102078725 isoform X1 [Oreochromis niloticus]|uniref:uncharacterized protein LOC102078725 isoform X1 n=2 Tax=Oreochromis niloticus TaxID=8128 RepID=UPI00039451C1|nr:uncharacterized protein LOC102078725 isoform X1 [Oreochromis niloticus]XP_005456097.1 uncharacterized protein LOC102078725 isoform X1 [Oreochromis niloticus]XP_019211086.1 uncharacterized protein LOC102078725 isoform X1 [Oreochromis niloticus]XP_025767071.1 uncharacterized protein LOC102078725 isoform X1 [Oreochromis niloticus]